MTKLDLVIRYVNQTGEKLKDISLVKGMFPKEWERIEREEEYRESLWWRLPEVFRDFRGINEFTTLELAHLAEEAEDERKEENG